MTEQPPTLITTIEMEDIWCRSLASVGLPIPEDYGDEDRYVFLGAGYYAGLDVVSAAARSKMTVISPAEAIDLIQAGIVDVQSPADHLNYDEQWQAAAVLAVNTVISRNAEVVNG